MNQDRIKNLVELRDYISRFACQTENQDDMMMIFGFSDRIEALLTSDKMENENIDNYKRPI